SAVHDREPGALSQCRSRAGSAQDERQVPPPLPACGRGAGGARQTAGGRYSRRDGNAVAGSEAGRMMEVRALTDRPQFADAVRIQKIVWGFEEIELLPVRLFVVATKIGGQAFGAYSGDEMAGFCLALPGLKPNGSAYLHSHMLGV